MSLPSSEAGYRAAAYAAALAGIGRARPLGETGGWVLERAIPGCDHTDLMGPYPLFACTDWAALGPAVAALKRPVSAGTEPVSHPVSLTLVTDPFCPLGPDRLGAIFGLCRPLGDHYLIDLGQPAAPSKHHRKKLRRAGPARIEAGPADPGLGPAFAALYAGLAEKKGIRDLRRFDADSLAAQLAVPGAHLVTAWAAETLIGADLYYLDAEVAHAHLSAYAPEGYDLSVSYPMMAAAQDYFAPRAAFINLGGVPAEKSGAGEAGAGGGIGHFKRGWTDRSRPTFLCGAVLDRAAYDRLSAARAPGSKPGTEWFPAYRAGEFG